MSATSTIEWTDATWNPVTGCDKVSPGCAHCYAETFAERFRGVPGHPFEQGFDLKLWPERLDMPLRWRKPRMVFVNSMSDLFHEQVPDEFVARVFDVMAHAPQHTFQVLTKRPERMRDLLLAWGEADRVLSWPDRLLPLPNVWLGTRIENRRFVHRADVLRETPAAVRFISAEPLLGPLVYDDDPDRGGEFEIEDSPSTLGPCWSDGYDGLDLDLTGIDWLIAGAESGHRNRPMREDWVRDLRDAARAAGTAFFYKQAATPAGRKIPVPELDGRQWTEMPAPARVAVVA